jgi:superfamily I DNA and/or RNA helicase
MLLLYLIFMCFSIYSAMVNFLTAPWLTKSLASCSEKTNGNDSKRENLAEAIAVALLVDALAVCGLKEKDIGVISPYRNQLKAIEKQV